jgi:hypothetical protein
MAHRDEALEDIAALGAHKLIDRHSVLIIAGIPLAVHTAGALIGESLGSYPTTAMASISTFTSLGRRATWTAARAGYGVLKNSP